MRPSPFCTSTTQHCRSMINLLYFLQLCGSHQCPLALLAAENMMVKGEKSIGEYLLLQVVWQSGFLLATFLIQHPPLGRWEGVRVVDLGTGTGKMLTCQ